MMYKKLENAIDLWVGKSVSNDSKLTSKQLYYEVLTKYMPKNKIEISYNEYGKPAIKGNNIFFNISNTNNITVLAISKNCEIGIDIELVNRKVLFPLLVAKKFFHPIEFEKLNILNVEVSKKFIELWVIKEAYVKMKGLGINYGLSNFIIDDNNRKIYDKDNTVYHYNLFNINEFICSIVPYFEKINIYYL